MVWIVRLAALTVIVIGGQGVIGLSLRGVGACSMDPDASLAGRALIIWSAGTLIGVAAFARFLH